MRSSLSHENALLKKNKLKFFLERRIQFLQVCLPLLYWLAKYFAPAWFLPDLGAARAFFN